MILEVQKKIVEGIDATSTLCGSVVCGPELSKLVKYYLHYTMGFPSGSVVKNPPANAGDLRDVGLIPWLGRSPGGGHGNPLQFSCLEKPRWTEEPGGLWSIGSRTV